MKRWLLKRVHVSWATACASLGLLAGAGLALVAPVEIFAEFYWVSLAISLFLGSVIFRNRAAIILAIVAGLCFGLWRGAIELRSLDTYSIYYEKQVSVRGTVGEDVAFGPGGDQRLRLNNVQVQEQALRGQIWVSTSSKADIKRGDVVTVKGRLQPGFGNLPASMFRASLIAAERPHPGDVAREVRDWFAAGIRVAIPEPEASLGIGYLTGQRSTLPESLDDQLRLLGLTHIVVASGYNLTILVRLARRSFARFSKYQATFAAAIMTLGFMFVTGFSPSMTRAGLVTGLSLAAWYYGRTIHPFVLLLFVAALTIAADPSSLWGDLGWYLSFLSFAGVIVLAPLLHDYFWGSKTPGIIRQILVDTSAAQIATLPLIAFVFGQYSPLALPANLLTLPFVPLAMLLTFASGIAGLVAPSVAAWFGMPAYAVLQYMTSLVDQLAKLPLAQGEIEVGTVALVASYGVLIGLVLCLWYKTKHNFRNNSIVS